MTLNEIGLSIGTDKSSTGHNYLSYYDKFLTEYRDRDIKLLEIGVWEGGSLRMWEQYFTKAKIVGFDIDEKRQYDTDRIKTFKGDQSNYSDLISVNEQFGSFDIINDDGSHYADHQIFSFEVLFPLLNSGGLYIIEDTLCSYDKERWGNKSNVYDRIRQMVGEVSMNGKLSNYHICSNKEQERHKYDLNYFEKNIEWIFVTCGSTIIKKF